MPRLRFAVTDVFTTRRFCGNPLAVVLGADGLDTAQMQAVAVEFGFSETIFVMRPENPAHSAKVRIFTPATEVPFAGHPNIGTAFVVARESAAPPARLVFEEAAGLVPLDILSDGGTVTGARLTAPEALSTGATYPRAAIAEALHLDVADIAATLHEPMVASVGLPFVMVEIASREALRRARPDAAAFARLLPGDGLDAIYLYTRDLASEDGTVDWTARMFAPSDGVAEDPATGSATAALAALLAALDPAFRDRPLTVAQGVDMGRPSLLEPMVASGGAVTLAGRCVPVMRGDIEL
jgi:trans-2,3-dihydro-3-hydroxyanthranilate isomerase